MATFVTMKKNRLYSFDGEKTVFILLQFLFNLNLREGFDDITHLQIIVVDK